MKNHSAFLCLVLFAVGFIVLFVLGHLYCPDCAGDLILLASVGLGLFALDIPGQ